MAALVPLNDQIISVITNDGRHFVGTMKGFDQCINLVLDDCHERVYQHEGGVEKVDLGLYVVRGDNLAIVGEMDVDEDKQQDLSKIRAEPLQPVSHS